MSSTPPKQPDLLSGPHGRTAPPTSNEELDMQEATAVGSNEPDTIPQRVERDEFGLPIRSEPHPKPAQEPRPDTVFHIIERDASGLPRPKGGAGKAPLKPRPDTVFRRVERDEFGLPRPVDPSNEAAKLLDSAFPDSEHGNSDQLDEKKQRPSPHEPTRSSTVQIEGRVLSRFPSPRVDPSEVHKNDPEPESLIRSTRTIPREPNLLPPRSPGSTEDVHTLIDPELKEVTETFAGRFDVLRQIGRGGMGAVFLAHQTGTQRQLAVKVLRGLRNKKDFIRFEREMNLMARISHPNVVKVFDYGQATNGATFLAMEYVEGQTLFELLYRKRLLPLQQTLRIAYYTALGLGAAHDKGIIHRDVKPENIMVSDHFGLPDFAQILDFGIAREAKSFTPGVAPLTSGGVFLGTPRYAAPEAIRGETLTNRTDIYSLGCLLFQLLAERCPFEDPSPLTVMDQHLKNRPTPMMRATKVAIPTELATLVDAMLNKRAQYRPESMAIVADRLSRWIDAPGGGADRFISPSPERPIAMTGFDDKPATKVESLVGGNESSERRGGLRKVTNPKRSLSRRLRPPTSFLPAAIWGLITLALAGWILFLTHL